MSYKPNYCCECGDRIERASWTFSSSRRFCDLCETNFRHLDWLPKITAALAAVLAVVLIGIYFKKPEKSFSLLNNQSANFAANSNRNVNSQTVAVPNADLLNSTASNIAVSAAQSKPANAASAVKPVEKVKSFENKSNGAPEEPVYFCGSQTKKGTPCTRRVKGGGRCWQHAGQPAMLPPEKLIAN